MPGSCGSRPDGFLTFVQSSSQDLPFAIDPMTLVIQVGVGESYRYQRAWNGSASVQVDNGNSIQLYMTCQSDCQDAEDAFALYLMEDSSTFSVETIF